MIHLVKAMVFLVVMYKCESWTIKKAECQRIDTFELWCWRRLWRVPWTSRRSNQSILKEISPEYSLEGLMMKLKLHYFGHLMQSAASLEKTLMLGKIEGRRRRGWQRMRWLDLHHRVDGHEFEQALGVGDGQGSLACCSSWDHRVGPDWVTELNWIVTAVGISSSIIITTIFNFIMLLSLLCSLMSPIFLKRSLVFPILLYSSTLRCSPKKAFLPLLAIFWNSAFSWVHC